MTLNISRIAEVTINMTPTLAPRRGFGTLLLVSDDDFISTGERIRTYTSLEGVLADSGTGNQVAADAEAYFSQVPRPARLMVGRFAADATAGLLKGGILSAAQRALSAWTGISDGSFTVSVDGAEQDVTGLDFTGATTLTGIAGIITAALTGAVCSWDGQRFFITSATTGVASTVGFAIQTGSGTDVSAQLKLDADGATASTDGIDTETALAAVVELAKNGQWYEIKFSTEIDPDDEDMADVAGYIEAATPNRVLVHTITDTGVLDSEVTDDLASVLAGAARRRSCVQYSPNRAAAASFAGRANSVNFNANAGLITLKFKQEPGIVPENLTETQANTLAAKRCNVFASYDNGTAILQEGVMSGPAFFDEIHGLDWFQDAAVTALYNLLYGSNKIPQTDAGLTTLCNALTGVCRQAVFNGLAAPGVWNAEGFGQLQRGDTIPGFYIYAAPMAAQAQEDRELRKAPPIQVALKLAGAFHSVGAIINVNR